MTECWINVYSIPAGSYWPERIWLGNEHPTREAAELKVSSRTRLLYRLHVRLKAETWREMWARPFRVEAGRN